MDYLQRKTSELNELYALRDEMQEEHQINSEIASYQQLIEELKESDFGNPKPTFQKNAPSVLKKIQKPKRKWFDQQKKRIKKICRISSVIIIIIAAIRLFSHLNNHPLEGGFVRNVLGVTESFPQALIYTIAFMLPLIVLTFFTSRIIDKKGETK